MKNTALNTNRTCRVVNLRAVAAAGLIGGICLVALPAHAQPLDLADRPLFTGETVDPNIMVAVDDSGSMDNETLFPTNSGFLYWNKSKDTFTPDGEYYNPDNGGGYGYLFPNGCGADGERVYCGGYSSALPPLPQFAFARSPQDNKAYFNPTTDYVPWVGDEYGSADPADANYEPALKPNLRVDLTKKIERNDYGYKFHLKKDMTIPPGVSYYHRDDPGFYEDSDPREIYYSQGRGIGYFPAKFYLKKDRDPQNGDVMLPEGYDYNGETTQGTGPNREEYEGFEIRPENFVGGANGSAYQSAIQNFANWFSYYRKRHLATRAGITSAFDEIQGARVGSCTINNPTTLTMRNLDAEDDSGNEAQRTAFYEDIFDIDFYEARGTPNRDGLKHLGEQLEDNPSIITLPCQRNYAILFTDGYNNEGTGGIGNADGKSSASSAYTPDPFGDSYPDTIADVAMKYYENLADPLNNRQQENYLERNQLNLPDACRETPPDPWLDCEKDLHMVTFGVTLGQQGTIFGNEAFPDENDDPYGNPPNWPDVNNTFGQPEQIDDLWHAAVNTRGKLLNASTPAEVADAFAAALERITAQTGSASAVAANTGSYSTESVVYQGSFTGGTWTGRLKAFSLSGPIQSDTDPIWDAAEQLTDNKRPNNRVILTSTPSGGGDNPEYSAAAFRESALPDGVGLTSNIVDYLRGHRSEERANGGDLRNRRDNILGDIVNSSPTFVGAPERVRYPTQWQWRDLRNDTASLPENNAADYSNPGSNNTFAQSYANRTPMVYVGANDGMLHGFSAETGEELLDYVPGAILGGLFDLADPNYIHRYYVDGPPAVGDVVFGNQWHTVLVSGLGNGGNSVFALDVTDPSAFSESNPGDTVLWEFTDENLGQTFGKPSIVRLHHGAWGAMVSSGYAGQSNGATTDSVPAALYLIDIESGDEIARIETPDGRGLSAPFPVDLDGDFITDYAYAGDLDGNVWKFDLTAAQPSQWSASRLFTAEALDTTPQPITTQPQVGVHPYGENYGVMVYFGTGKYLEPSDAAVDTSLQNSFYGIWDLDVFSFNEASNGEPIFTPGITTDIPRSRLTQQTVVTDVNKNGRRYRVLSDNDVPYQTTAPDSDGQRGWVIDGFDPGELIVSKPRLEFGTLSFSTRIPSVQSCTAQGSGYFMLVDAGTGGRTEFPAFDLNDDNQYTQADDTIDVDVDGEKASASGVAIQQGAPGESLFLVNRDKGDDRVILPRSDASITQVDVNLGRPPDGRRSWREIRR
jgi:type IV pilus assembly protein PilY1